VAQSLKSERLLLSIYFWRILTFSNILYKKDSAFSPAFTDTLEGTIKDIFELQITEGKAGRSPFLLPRPLARAHLGLRRPSPAALALQSTAPMSSSAVTSLFCVLFRHDKQLRWLRNHGVRRTAGRVVAEAGLTSEAGQAVLCLMDTGEDTIVKVVLPPVTVLE
jgi:hypothetical protein